MAICYLIAITLLVSCIKSSHRRTDPCSPERTESTDGGGLTMGEVAGVIRKNNSAFVYCYEELLEHQPGVRGKVKVKFVIDASGLVSDSQIIKSDIDDDNFKNCIRSRINRLKFPRPRGCSKVDVSYPFTFNPV